MKKQIKRLSAIMLAVFLLVWGAALVKCEILTHQYGIEFEPLCRNNQYLSVDMEYLKVVSMSDTAAEVYYVTEDMSTGNLVTFELHSGTWVETCWDTIWSDSGNAAGVIWPYWWHFIYGGL